jgi:ABC-type multidrug transport system fused ATPase/permease subunit
MASLKAVMTAMDDLEREQEPSGGEEIFPSTFGAIRFDNVSFHYDNKKIAALSEVTVEFNAGTFIALVGPNGAGKSTLVDLLPRLRDPTRGRIEVDGTPLTNFTLNSLRQNTAFVSQEPQLFDVTIQEHIRYSCAGANDKEVREAARLASAVGFIEALPEGYDTQLGERGVRLSGGQRQRIDLARALLCRAPVLIMDEPASGLDARAAGQFREIMMQIRQQAGTTIILIAHGFSTVMDADQIVVLEAGRITDTGTHEELLSRDGWYAKAFAEQTSSGASSRAARGAG